jgi:type IV secretory pathway VirB6-like protein
MDSLAKFVLSPDMIIAVLGATLASGPYGLMMGGMLGLATVGLLKLLITGLKTYAVSFIVRAVLLGLAPVFIVFLLFEKTKQLFTSWLNVLIALSLQPILFFTFISFFLVMMVSASKDMLGGNELCWTEYAGAAGTTNKLSGWRFKMKGENAPSTEEWTWEGALSCKFKGKTTDGKPCPPFPINILDLLSFLILVYVAQRFADVVDNIANDIASTAVNLGVDARQQLQAERKQEGGGAGGGNSANTSAGAVTQLPPGRR